MASCRDVISEPLPTAPMCTETISNRLASDPPFPNHMYSWMRPATARCCSCFTLRPEDILVFIRRLSDEAEVDPCLVSLHVLPVPASSCSSSFIDGQVWTSSQDVSAREVYFLRVPYTYSTSNACSQVQEGYSSVFMISEILRQQQLFPHKPSLELSDNLTASHFVTLADTTEEFPGSHGTLPPTANT